MLEFFQVNEMVAFLGLNTNNNEMGVAYREKVRLLADWCQKNNLSLSVSKTKQLVMDFRKQKVAHAPINSEGKAVERVNSFRFFGVPFSTNLK